MKPDKSKQAFVLHMSYRGKEPLKEGLDKNEIIIGWSRAQGLLEPTLDWREFRQIIHDTYFSDDQNYRRSGASAGNMWRFVRQMDVEDLVVVPSSGKFYLAKITGKARYDEIGAEVDMAHRRSVKWLNNGKSFPRKIARAALQSRMKARQACVNATDLLPEIEEVLEAAKNDEELSLSTDLRKKMVDNVINELRSGRINPREFEDLIAEILRSLGGRDVRVIGRKVDIGVDVIGDFSLASFFTFKLGVQCKHYKPKPPVPYDALAQLVEGLEGEDASVGWLVTTGTIPDEVEKRKREFEEERGLMLELVDGEQLAAFIVEGGLSVTGILKKQNKR